MALHRDELSIQHSLRTKNRMPFKELSETLNFTECCKTMEGYIQHETVWVNVLYCGKSFISLYIHTNTYQILPHNFKLINSTHFVCNVRAAHANKMCGDEWETDRDGEMRGGASEMWHLWVNESNNGISLDKGVVRFSFLWQSWLSERRALADGPSVRIVLDTF